MIMITTITLASYLYGVHLALNYKIAEIHNLSVKYRVSDQMFSSIDIPEGTRNLYVCGVITSGADNYLVISLLSEDEKTFFGKDNMDSPYETGDFCTEIKIKARLIAGKYKIIIIDSHKRIGELMFQVK